MSTIPKPFRNECIQVAVRCRPMTQKEKAKGYKCVIKPQQATGVLETYDPKCDRQNGYKFFKFDAVYDWNSSLECLYNNMVRPLISDVMHGFNATVFAYGQTGTGKTYTMEGDETCESSKGIIPRVFEQIFNEISRSENSQYLLTASYMEIYQDEIRDLLSQNSSGKLEIRENHNGAFVENLTNVVVKSHQHIVQLFEFGKMSRTTRTTNMNEKSSRSHAIFSILVEMIGLEGTPLENTSWIGRLNLVDLAGSERQNKTNSEGTRLKEASKINLSLTALGNVISALQDRRGNYIPYRDSKLTRLLQDSLGGNSKTLMIANIGPACYNYDESLNTLRYASRARDIKNKPRINEDPVDTVLKHYQEEISKLKALIAERDATRKEKLKEAAANCGKEDKRINYVSPIVNNDDGTSLFCETPEKRKLDKMKMEMKKKENESLMESEAEKKSIEDLTETIKEMERSMLRGSANILDHTNEQQKALEAHAVEIRKRKEREYEMQQMLEMQEETADEIKGEFSNLKQEVELKSKRLKKIHSKFQHFENEIHDIVEEFNVDRRELEVTQDELLRELKLALVIIDNFIPAEERKRIFSRLFYDEDSDAWKIMPDSEPDQDLARPQCIGYMQNKQPTHIATSEPEINQLSDCDSVESRKTRVNRFTVFRNKTEDVINLDLVSPLRTTRDYESPKMSPVLKSIFDAALKGEEDIDVDAANVSSRNSFTRLRSGMIPRSNITPPRLVSKVLNSSSSIVPLASSTPIYPKARGWVPK